MHCTQCIHTYTYACIHARAHRHMYNHTSTRTHKHTYMDAYIHKHVHPLIRSYAAFGSTSSEQHSCSMGPDALRGPEVLRRKQRIPKDLRDVQNSFESWCCHASIMQSWCIAPLLIIVGSAGSANPYARPMSKNPVQKPYTFNVDVNPTVTLPEAAATRPIPKQE